MKRSTWGAGAAIAVALLLVAPTAHAADQASPVAADGSEPSFPAGHLTQVAIPLEHPLSLSDAMLEAANYAEKVMAFRYDHDIVVGDYVLTEESRQRCQSFARPHSGHCHLGSSSPPAISMGTSSRGQLGAVPSVSGCVSDFGSEEDSAWASWFECVPEGVDWGGIQLPREDVVQAHAHGGG